MAINNLVDQVCTPCTKTSAALTCDQIDQLIGLLPQWQVLELNGVSQLTRSYSCADFNGAMDGASIVAKLAEAHSHHPALVIEWGKITVTWWTHSINGLHQNDFILAAKTDQLLDKNKSSNV